MNPSLLFRAFTRHRYMRDLPAYREFLEEVRSAGSAWMVPQAQIADWWERRQLAHLEVRIEDGALVLSSDLAGACVERDGNDVRVLPVRVEHGVPGRGLPEYDRSLASPFFSEVLGHLGYGHVGAGDGSVAVLSANRLGPIMERLRHSAVTHQRFDEEDVRALRGVFSEAHHAHGLPDLRLWTLPEIGGMPARVAVSSRYDVDKAIVNLPEIHDLEERFGLRSSVYLRPVGMFYGRPEIKRYLDRVGEHEIALHGEFVTSAEERFGDEFAAAKGEKALLEEMVGREVVGVCMHGGELRTNTSPQTRDAVEQAGFRYETMYRNRYHLPLHLPSGDGVRRTLSVGQHFADITVAGDEYFSENLTRAFLDQYAAARDSGGVFVPVMHPLYFNVGHYARKPMSVIRIAAFMPQFLGRVLRMKSGQHYSNVP